MPTIDQSNQRAIAERLYVKKLSDTEYRVINPVKGTEYSILKSASGVFRCDCPFMTKSSHVGTQGVCKHMTLLDNVLKAKRIYVGTRGKYALVDAEDFDYLNQFSWSELKVRKTTYARRTIRFANGKQKTILMHKEILRDVIYNEIDHVNDDGLDNRRNNLREATPSQHRSRHEMPRKVSRFRGVCRADSKIERYSAAINVNGIKKYLGVFDTDVQAAKAYDKAARAAYGPFATTNF